jgi:mannose-1-phosphate guanylyltransferase
MTQAHDRDRNMTMNQTVNQTVNHLYALILAGGKGSRLWPLSQKDHPKALLKLFGERSLFQETVARLEGHVPSDHVYVVARPELCDRLQAQTPSTPAANFIHEPNEKDSGPALALAAFHIAKCDPDAVLAVFSVDHHIRDQARLRAVLNHAAGLAVEGWIVTLGIPPHTPETRFGYIERGNVFSPGDTFSTYHVRAFVEKPNVETARAFLRTGTYFWDSGIVVVKTARLLSEFERQQPALMHAIRSGSPRAWNTIQPISLDYAIMQAAENILVIEADFGWADVGNWDTVFNILMGSAQDACGNVAEPLQTLINTRHTFIHSSRPVVAIGLDDLIVVDTDDGLLICKLGQSEQIRAAFDGKIGSMQKTS